MTRETPMATMFVRHTVADYAAWRRIFDGFAPTQEAMGVTDKAVYQEVDNPNDITVTHDFATLEDARAFAGSAELKAAMHDAGVTSAPTIWFTERV
jgi:hypothetical protein